MERVKRTQPQARPVERVSGSVFPVKPAVDNRLGELAMALQGLSAPLANIAAQYLGANQEREAREGMAAGLTHKTWQEILASGKGDVTESPFFRKGFLETKGRLAGYAYQSFLSQAYENWPHQVQLNENVLGDIGVDEEPFLGFLETSRKAFLDAQGEEGHLSDWRSGFMPQLSMVEQNLLHQHVAQSREELRGERLRNLSAEVNQVLSMGFAGEDIKKIEDEAIFSGLSHKEVVATVLGSLVINAKDHPFGDEMLATYGSLHKDEPKVLEAVEAAREHQEYAAYRKETQAFQEGQRARARLRREALSAATAALLDDPNYSPAPEEVKAYVDAGFYEYPRLVEHLRSALSTIPKHVDAQAKTRYFGRLRAGTLGDEDILAADFLSAHDKRVFFAHKKGQEVVLNHPVTQSAIQEIISHFTSSILGSLERGVPEEAYKAKRLFQVLLLEAYRDNPTLSDDPLGFSAAITALKKKVLKKGKVEDKDNLDSSGPSP